MADPIYMQCIEAGRELLDDWRLRPMTQGAEGVFTELDVIFLAARYAGGYDEEQMRRAPRHASQAMINLYNRGLAVRFGPVQPPNDSEPDYVRAVSKIAYSSADEGPEEIVTPNGTFSRIMSMDDSLTRTGRRLGTNRDDLKPWSEQEFVGPRQMTSEQREILRLSSENAALRARIEELERNALVRLPLPVPRARRVS